MTSRASLLALLFVGACGGDPPKSDTPASAPAQDKTEVKMEAVPVTSSVPEPPPTSTASSTVATTTPPPSSDPSDDPNIGGPQDATVEKAVAPIRPRIRACYKKALAAQPGQAGAVTFDTTIGKDGKVSSARFVKKDGNLSDDLVSCLTTAAKAMQFAPDRKTQVVAFTFGQPSGGTGSTPASISSGKALPPPTAPVASFGGPDAGPNRH